GPDTLLLLIVSLRMLHFSLVNLCHLQLPKQLPLWLPQQSTTLRCLSFTALREPYVPVPNCYLGEVGCCDSFLLWLSLVSDLQPSMYSSDKAKIAFVVNLLSGHAAQWVTVIENCAPPSVNYEAFWGGHSKPLFWISSPIQ
uniref:DUF4939 domain-containing protein n=1 Tax=Takifugu rubripes TaxID=31033 RepID=A0A674PNR8_TAKRU